MDNTSYSVMVRKGTSWTARGEKMPSFNQACDWAAYLIKEPEHEEVRVIGEQTGTSYRVFVRREGRIYVAASCLRCKRTLNPMTSEHVPGTIVWCCEHCYQNELRAGLSSELALRESETKNERRQNRFSAYSGIIPGRESAEVRDLPAPDP